MRSGSPRRSLFSIACLESEVSGWSSSNVRACSAESRRNARISNPAPSKTSCPAVCSASVASSSIHLVRAMPAARAPGDARSSSLSTIWRPAGKVANRESPFRHPRRKSGASESTNRREVAGREDSRARNNAIYSAVRLARLVTKTSRYQLSDDTSDSAILLGSKRRTRNRVEVCRFLERTEASTNSQRTPVRVRPYLQSGTQGPRRGQLAVSRAYHGFETGRGLSFW